MEWLRQPVLIENPACGVSSTRPSLSDRVVSATSRSSREAAFAMVHNLKEMTGQRFGRLVVLERAENKWLQARWRCRCDCGAVRDVDGYNLRSGHTSSCGCSKREQAPTPFERFLSKIAPVESGCWLWTGWRSELGYGRFRMGPPDFKMAVAPRVSYEFFVGPIPDGHHIDHLCRTPSCVNPDHLEPVTPRENTRRGLAPAIVVARTGACARGHPRTPEHGWFRKDRPGSWYCVTCERDRRRVRAARRKEVQA